jgi:hypothetical protein
MAFSAGVGVGDIAGNRQSAWSCLLSDVGEADPLSSQHCHLVTPMDQPDGNATTESVRGTHHHCPHDCSSYFDTDGNNTISFVGDHSCDLKCRAFGKVGATSMPDGDRRLRGGPAIG